MENFLEPITSDLKAKLDAEFNNENPEKYDPINAHKRKYKRGIKEAIKILQIELDTLEKNPLKFEASEGIPGILLELIKINQRLIGMEELSE